MKLKWKGKLGTAAVIASMLFSALPGYAAEGDAITVILEDITSQPPVLAGETKIKVSVTGLDTEINLAQIVLDITGDMEYKSIQFLTEESQTDAPEFAEAVKIADDKLLASIVRIGEPVTEVSASEVTDLFILTFSGEVEDEMNISVVEGEDDSYFGANYPENQEIINATAQNEGGITAKAAATGAEAVEAKITLEMTKVHDFVYLNTQDSKESGIDISIIGEDEEHPIMFTIPIKKSTGAIIPTMELEATLIKDKTYTVEVSGAGYIPYKATGVDFANPLELTNDDFIPGELVEDGVIDSKDKDMFYEIMADIENGADYNMAADFNRDGKVDEADAKVYSAVADEAKAPAKMAAPTVEGGKQEITVKWTKPEDNGSEITGYVIKYGKSGSSNLTEIKITDNKATNKTITGLANDTTYAVQIAAENAVGTGEFSDVATAKTNAVTSTGTTTGGGGGGGGTGGGSTGGSSIGGGLPIGGAVTGNTQNTATEEFTDLGNHAWAKDAIYTLKDKGIISGTSETTYSPANNIKRGDFILILTKMLEINNEFTENFADVPEGKYYYNAIGAAKAAGIAQGSGANFNPENTITRQDLITLAYRAFLNKGYISEAGDLTSLDAFADKDNISDYAASAMASMVSAGIIQGSNGNVNPKGNATRAEVAVMCARLLNLMK